MEEIINRQIDGILNKGALYTRNVFVPNEIKETIEFIKETDNYVRQEEIANRIQKRVSEN